MCRPRVSNLFAQFGLNRGLVGQDMQYTRKSRRSCVHSGSYESTTGMMSINEQFNWQLQRAPRTTSVQWVRVRGDVLSRTLPCLLWLCDPLALMYERRRRSRDIRRMLMMSLPRPTCSTTASSPFSKASLFPSIMLTEVEYMMSVIFRSVCISFEGIILTMKLRKLGGPIFTK